MPPSDSTATNLRPSAEDATEFHWLLGAFARSGVAPEFVAVWIPPP
jgi:hypothetical protein